MISQKNVQMLSFLCDCAREHRNVTVNELAMQFHISSRMVRYNLDQIDYYLSFSGFPKLMRHKSSGVFLDVPEDVTYRIEEVLCGIRTDMYVLSRSERELLIYLQLFDSDTPIKYEDLADTLSVSRKTVIYDVRHMRESDAGRDMDIRPTKNGIVYLGDEFHLRRVILDKTLEMFSPMELWKVILGENLNKSIPIEKKWSDITSGFPTDVINRELCRIEEEKGWTNSDEEFYIVMILCTIAVSRLGRGRLDRQEELRGGDSLPMLQAFFQRLDTAVGVSIPVEERRYVASELKRLLNWSRQENAEKLAGVIVESLILGVSKATGRDYYLDDTLRTGLHSHMFDLLKDGTSHRNDDKITLQEVVKKNKEAFDCIKRCLEEFNGICNCDWDDCECALIMLHFFAANERQCLMDTSAYRALVVCTNGVGSAHLVSAKVEKYFPQVHVVETASIHNMAAIIERNQPDFILTTIPLAEENVPVIRVNTLMTETDLDHIRNFIIDNPKEASNIGRDDMYKELKALIARTCQVRNPEELEQRMRRILNIKQKRQTGLSELVKEDCILLGLDAQDWESAVRKSAEPLVEGSYIEPRYVEAMISNIREMGPYIVISPGIAMPHSLPKDGVIQSCMGLAVLKRAVEFGHKVNDPVRIVICMGTKEGQEHMKGMSELINLLSNDTTLQSIIHAKSSGEVMEIVREYSKTEP
jgi:mannitol/fructose-specific phosphotransferase system IIA component (Ntr-type)/transcriptional antiterminator